MTENEKALIIESQQPLSNTIIPEYQRKSNIQTSNQVFDYSIYQDEKNLKMPKIVSNIVYDFVKPLYSDNSTSTILVTSLALLSHAIGHKRISFDEFSNNTNVKQQCFYGINFMVSGGGKDKLINDLNNNIFEKINTYVQTKANKYIEEFNENVKEEAKAIKNYNERQSFIKENLMRNVEFVLCNATPEGFYEDNKTILLLDTGSMLCLITELALFLHENDDRKKQLINMLYNAYDGNITTKSIKGENRDRNLTGANVCVLLCSDPSLMLDNGVKSYFDYLLKTGMIRRSFISFQEKSNLTVGTDAEKEYLKQKTTYSNTSIKEALFKIFLDIPTKAIYKLSKEVFIKTFYPYQQYISQLHNKVEDSNAQREIKSRILKSLKLATLFASLNHPKDLYIYDEDFEQAISITEFLSVDFYKFQLYINTSKKDCYDKVFAFLQNNLGEKFTKTNLVNDHYSDFGFQREHFRDSKRFEEVFKIVDEIATNKGYKLNMVKHNGFTIWLERALNTDKLPDDFKPLEEII